MRAHHPLVQLTLVRCRVFLREPSAVFWTFGFPILLSLALGFAFKNRPPDASRVAIETSDRAAAVARALDEGGGFVTTILDPAAAAQGLRAGRVALVVRVAPSGERTYLFDETRAESRIARLRADDRLQRADGRADVTPVNDLLVTEVGARYIDFLVPGLIGMNVLSSGMWGIGYLIVEMRTKKLVKRMTATPMKKRDFLLSFVLMRMAVLVFEVPFLLVFSRLLFGVRIAGPVGALVVVLLAGALAFSALGILVASRAQTTHAVGGLINAVIMPMLIGSGVFFSAQNFPAEAQPVVHAMPLTVLNDALRVVMNEGGGYAAIMVPTMILGAWAVITFALALRLFRWR